MNIKKLNVLGVVTARGGSKGIPRKNIKVLGNRPLISYTIDVAKRSRLLSNVIVSTDDQEIADVAIQCGGEVPFMRPLELATDKISHVPVMQHATRFMENKLDTVFDYIVILQPTSPFRLPEDIDKTIQKAIEYKASGAVSLVEIESNHPTKIKRLDGDRVLPYCLEEDEGMRRQDLPIAYKRSGAVYVTKRDTLINDGLIYGDYVVGHVVPRERSIDIDYPIDWVMAEYMLKELNKKGYEF